MTTVLYRISFEKCSNVIFPGFIGLIGSKIQSTGCVLSTAKQAVVFQTKTPYHYWIFDYFGYTALGK